MNPIMNEINTAASKGLNNNTIAIKIPSTFKIIDNKWNMPLDLSAGVTVKIAITLLIMNQTAKI